MGLANYYSKFVKGFSTVAALLMGLCSPRASFRWDQAEQASFNALKAALTSARMGKRTTDATHHRRF